MTLQVLPPQDLIRKTIIEVVSLPEKEMLAVLEFVGKIKQREKDGLPKLTVAEIHAEANRIAAELATDVVTALRVADKAAQTSVTSAT